MPFGTLINVTHVGIVCLIPSQSGVLECHPVDRPNEKMLCYFELVRKVLGSK